MTPAPLWVTCLALLLPVGLLLVVAIAACAFAYGWRHDTGSVRLNVFIYCEVFGVSVLLLLGFAGMAGMGGYYRSALADGAFAWLFVLLIPVALVGLVLPGLLGPVSQWGDALARWAL